MSVWVGIDAMKDFVYKSGHVELIRDCHAWFRKCVAAHQALWWVSEGHTPTIEEAKEKLEAIQKKRTNILRFSF